MQSTFKQIVDDVVARHHSLLRRELPNISELLEKLNSDVPQSESLGEAQQIYKKVRTKIETHLKDEETILFPTGIALESGGSVPATDMDLMARLAEMEKEHDGCTNALTTISDMIASVKQTSLRDKLLETIRVVQEDLRIHVEKENTQVHPRFVELLATARA